VRFGPRLPGPEHVQAHTGDDRVQPAAEVVDLAGVRAAEAQPGLLDSVVGVVRGAEDPEGDGPQAIAMFFEALGEPLAVGHLITHGHVHQTHETAPM
jgi:hypothetical protein